MAGRDEVRRGSCEAEWVEESAAAELEYRCLKVALCRRGYDRMLCLMYLEHRRACRSIWLDYPNS